MLTDLTLVMIGAMAGLYGLGILASWDPFGFLLAGLWFDF